MEGPTTRPAPPPPFPCDKPSKFRATIHGTVFGERAGRVDTLQEGDSVRVVPDPPVQERPEVWIHLVSGEPVGHLPPDIATWLWPWLRDGGRAEARTVRVHGTRAPSWRRLLVEVDCEIG